MLNMDSLTLQDLEDVADLIGPDLLDAVMAGGTGEIESAADRMRTLVAIHFVVQRHRQPSWTHQDSANLPLMRVVEELDDGGDDAPKLGSPDGRIG